MSRRGSVRLLVLVVVLAVVAAVVAGLALAGSPGDARLQRLDRQRVSDLYRIADGINMYWARHQTLPPDLETLLEELAFDPYVDPDTGLPYTYRIVASDRYEICATFATDCRRVDGTCVPWRANRDWQVPGHGVGEQCFPITPTMPSGNRVP